MRFIKKDEYIEIVGALSVNHNGEEVYIIESSIGLKHLPSFLKVQIPKSDKVGLENLKSKLTDWAKQNGYAYIKTKETIS